MASMKGLTALVTGASSGLGVEFARQLAAEGCALVLVARRLDRLQALRAELAQRYGARAECVALDLTEPDAPQRLFRQTQAAGMRVDILINNAGLGLFGGFLDTPWERTQQMLRLDILALTQLTYLFAADMRTRKSGWILQVASTGAFQPTPTYAAYSAAKSYVLSLGEALHFELRGSGVQCATLCPGVTRTEFFEVADQTPTLFQRMTMMESAAVAQIGLRALWAGRASVVAGRVNGLTTFFMRMLPRQWAAALADRAMR
jgi:short-subunit dehydrogenase